MATTKKIMLARIFFVFYIFDIIGLMTIAKQHYWVSLSLFMFLGLCDLFLTHYILFKVKMKKSFELNPTPYLLMKSFKEFWWIPQLAIFTAILTIVYLKKFYSDPLWFFFIGLQSTVVMNNFLIASFKKKKNGKR